MLELTRHASRRYSQLRPQDVESNLFMYHLKGLLKAGLIQKANGAYQLSTKGLETVGLLSLSTGKIRLQPKILTAVICKNQAGEHLLARWHRQPNIGQISFVHGMLHFGRTALEMAATELAEKAGLEADLKHRGEVYVRGLRADSVDRHMLVHVFEALNPRPSRQNELRPEVAEAFWAPLEQFTQADFVPGFWEIVQIYESTPGPFFQEITVRLAA